MRKLCFRLATLGLLSMACSGPTDAEAPEQVLVELDVFSGKPNPTWRLTVIESSRLRAHFDGLRQTESVAEHPGRLGYRGFFLFGVRTTNDRWSVADGFVVVDSDAAARRAYHDSTGVETWLLEQARQRGFGAQLPR